MQQNLYLSRSILPLLGNVVVSELLVQSSPGLSPHQLSRLLSVVQQGSGLGGAHKHGLAVSADELDAVARVDSVFAESAKFGSVCRQ